MAENTGKSRFNKSAEGYSVEDVDKYVEQMNGAYSKLSERCRQSDKRLLFALKKLESLTLELQKNYSGESEQSADAQANDEEKIEEARAKAEKLISDAEQIKADSERNAVELIRSANAKASEIVKKAEEIRASAEQNLAAANEESVKIISSAKLRAEAVVSGSAGRARNAAENIIKDAALAARKIIKDAEIKANNACREVLAVYKAAEEMYNEVSSFRGSLFSLYSDHIESIQTITGSAHELVDSVDGIVRNLDEKDDSRAEDAKIAAEPQAEQPDELVAQNDAPTDNEAAVAVEYRAESDETEEIEKEPTQLSLEDQPTDDEDDGEADGQAAKSEEFAYQSDDTDAGDDGDDTDDTAEMAVSAVYDGEYYDSFDELPEDEEDYRELADEEEVEEIDNADALDEAEGLEAPEEPEEIDDADALDEIEVIEESEEIEESEDVEDSDDSDALAEIKHVEPVKSAVSVDDVNKSLIEELQIGGFKADIGEKPLDENDFELPDDIWSGTNVLDIVNHIGPEKKKPTAEDDFSDLEKMFSNEFGVSADEFDRVFSSKDTKKNINEIQNQPLVPPIEPSRPKKHSKF